MWSDIKLSVVELAGVSKDTLHVHIGLIIFFGSAFLLKRVPVSVLPWLIVLGLELVNEAMDLLGQRHLVMAEWAGSLRDLFNTMLWPTILMFAARARQRRLLVLGRREIAPAAGI